MVAEASAEMDSTAADRWRRRRRSGKVSWACGDDLRKVRLFLSEDAPCVSGIGTQDHFQARSSLPSQTTGCRDSAVLFPPGFGSCLSNKPKIDVSRIPVVKWRCPPSMVLNPSWLVVAGDESTEIAVQDKRSLTVLEAMYPRKCNIPANPLIAPAVQDSCYDDLQTPTIPIIAIEETMADQMEPSQLAAPVSYLHLPAMPMPLERAPPAFSLAQHSTLKEQQLVPPVSSLHGIAKSKMSTAATAEPDVLAAASAVVTAMTMTKKDSMIDHELLVKLLSNPEHITNLLSEHRRLQQHNKLLAEHGLSSEGTTSASAQVCNALPDHRRSPNGAEPFCGPQSTSKGTIAVPAVHTELSQPRSAFSAPTSVKYTKSSDVLTPAVTLMSENRLSSNCLVKDRNYYKSLIQRHGGDKQEVSELNRLHFATFQNKFTSPGEADAARNGVDKHHDIKHKSSKPCMYFNTPRGCRNGINCSFRHDNAVPRQEEVLHLPKRMKLDGWGRI